MTDITIPDPLPPAVIDCNGDVWWKWDTGRYATSGTSITGYAELAEDDALLERFLAYTEPSKHPRQHDSEGN